MGESGLCHPGWVTLGKWLLRGSQSCSLAMSRLDHSWLTPSVVQRAPASGFPQEPVKFRFPGLVPLH